MTFRSNAETDYSVDRQPGLETCSPTTTQRRKTHEIRLCWHVRDRGYLSPGDGALECADGNTEEFHWDGVCEDFPPANS